MKTLLLLATALATALAHEPQLSCCPAGRVAPPRVAALQSAKPSKQPAPPKSPAPAPGPDSKEQKPRPARPAHLFM